MLITFLSHIYKDFIRSSSAGRQIVIQIAILFIVVLVAGFSVAAGFALEGIIVNGLKQSNPVVFLNGLLVYYFIGEFATRYFAQSVPMLDVQPYLHLPIARSRIVHFLLGRSMMHAMNTLVFLLFTAFALNVVAETYGMSRAWMWLLSIWFVSMTNHFLVMLLKKSLGENIWGLGALLLLSALLAASNYFEWFQLSSVSEACFGDTLLGYTSFPGLLLVVTMLYLICYNFFLARLYPEERTVEENRSISFASLPFFQEFGVIGSWIKIELKMIMRHKRTRTVLLSNIVTIFYLLIFYSTRQNHQAYGAWIFFGIIGSGMFVINYGQYLFSWQGKHFDFLLTRPTSIRTFVESKFWILAGMTAVLLLLSIPYLYFGWTFLLVHIACSFYNVGVNTFVVMNMAMWKPNSIDLTKGGTLNYEWMGTAQWLMGLPILLGPYVFYIPFKLMGHAMLGLVAVGIAGLIGIIFHRKLIDLTARRLFNMRYSIASNFREG